MGEIADMHVEAWAAGLDPNEMDGADWADFYAETEPLYDTDADAARAFGSEMWGWLIQGILASRAKEGETIQATMTRLFPKLTPGQIAGFLAVCEAIEPDDI